MKGNPNKLKDEPNGFNPDMLTVPQPERQTLLCSHGTAAAYLQRLGCTPGEVEFYQRNANPLAPTKITITTKHTKHIAMRFETQSGNEVEMEF